MRKDKIVSVTALSIQFLAVVFSESVRFSIRDIFSFIRHGGNFFMVYLEFMLFLCVPFVYALVITAFFRKKNNSVFYLLSAVMLLPSAIFTPQVDAEYTFFFTLPCVMFIISAFIAFREEKQKKLRSVKR